MITESLARFDPTRTWRSASALDKVRLYTHQSFIGLGVLIGGFGAVSMAVAGHGIASGLFVVAAAASVVAVARIPALGSRVERPLGVVLGVAVVAGVGSVAAAYASGGDALPALLPRPARCRGSGLVCGGGEE